MNITGRFSAAPKPIGINTAPTPSITQTPSAADWPGWPNSPIIFCGSASDTPFRLPTSSEPLAWFATASQPFETRPSDRSAQCYFGTLVRRDQRSDPTSPAASRPHTPSVSTLPCAGSVRVMTPEQARDRARIAARIRWSRRGQREAQAEASRRALWRRFEHQVDPDGHLPPGERSQLARCAARAHSARMTAALARRRAAGASSSSTFG